MVNIKLFADGAGKGNAEGVSNKRCAESKSVKVN